MSIHVDVLHAELHDKDGQQIWIMETKVARDGQSPLRLTHGMPADTMAWRAAEYGLDIEHNLDELLELVLIEPYLPHHDPGLGLFDTDTVTAREHLRFRVRNARMPGRRRAIKGVIGTPPPMQPFTGARLMRAATATEDPLEVILRESPTTKEDVATRRRKHLVYRASVLGPPLGPRALPTGA